MTNAAACVYFNGRFVPVTRAAVSIHDRGFLYGDGLFETIRLYRGRPFEFDKHLARLAHSAQVLAIPLPATDWRSVAMELLRRNGAAGDDGWLRIAVSRGGGGRGLPPPAVPSPTTVITHGPLDPTIDTRCRRGIAVVTTRVVRSPTLAPHKTANYLDGIAARLESAHANADDALFRDVAGNITESTIANLFVVRRNEIWTPPLGAILPGITRATVLHLAMECGLRIHEKPITPRRLRGADEIFLTNSLAEITPVVKLDGDAVGTARPGPVTRLLQKRYRAVTCPSKKDRPRRG